MSFQSFGFIGLGLIGGSVAKALRNARPDCDIIAYDPNEESIQLAVKEKIVNKGVDCISSDFASCDLIFLCAPVSDNDSNLHTLSKIIGKNTIISDVGSVKNRIRNNIDTLNLTSQFIGGHPMAGSERTGYINSKAILIENAYYIVAPGDGVEPQKITDFKQLIKDLGAIPLVLESQKHDYVTGAISHLPHVIAASLVNFVKKSDDAEGTMKAIAAGGFKDITRIASSSPEMWQQICLTNGNNIAELLDKYIDSLQKIKTQIEQSKKEELFDFFKDAREYRDSFISSSTGPIKASYVIRVEIADRPGVIALVSTLLGWHDISIKNIGIVHNREHTDGVIRVELNSESDLTKAKKVLESNDFVCYINS